MKTGDRVAAWNYLQEALMENMYILVPKEVSMKDLISTCTGIEEMLEGRTGDKGKSPAETMAEFLNEI